MKCIFVGVFNEQSTNFSQNKCLNEIGCEVNTFEYRQIAKKIGNKERDNLLIETVKNIKPDFLLISKGSTIDSNAIKECNKYTKIILWFMDTMYTWNKELEKKIQVCHSVACAWVIPYEKALKINPNSHHVIEGFDPQIDKPISIPQEIDASFIGKTDGDRLSYIEAVNATVFTDVYGMYHPLAVSKSKININLTRIGGTSDRVYKVMAAKGFLLTQEWPGCEKEFDIGKDLVIFTDKDSLKEKVKYYLEHANERNSIRESGYKAVQKYSRTEWAKKIVEIAK